MKLERFIVKPEGPRWSRLAVTVAGVALLVVGASSAVAQSRTSKSKAATPAAAVPAIKVAPTSLLVYIDTKTLTLDLQPAAGRVPFELTADVLNALDTSDEGQKRVTVNGFTRIDLNGRFRPVWVAITDEQGKLRPFCLTSLPAPVAVAAKAVRDKGVRDGR